MRDRLLEPCLPFLRAIAEAPRPVLWDGMGHDRTVPEKYARRLAERRFIVHRNGLWHITADGRLALRVTL